MPRDFQINGACMTAVRFGDHLPTSISNIPGSPTNLSELGLASQDMVTVSPTYRHADIPTDAFGPDVPAEIMAQIAECQIRVPLVHYDWDILEYCLSESLGGIENLGGPGAGTMPPAGSLLGNLREYLASGYHFVGLNFTSPVLGRPWHFPAAYLIEQPAVMQIGTKRSVAMTTWRAIPYPYKLMTGAWVSGVEITSSGAVLWDRVPDT